MRAILSAAAILFVATSANAKGVFPVSDVMSEAGYVHQTVGKRHASASHRKARRAHVGRYHAVRSRARHYARTPVNSRGDVHIVGSRPAGCPRRYCGCEAARYLGIHDPRGTLNLAWNWARYFRRTEAHVGAAAVRPGHVLVIIGGSPGRWFVHDGNSGGGLTREHYRPLNGYVFVDPSSRVAAR